MKVIDNNTSKKSHAERLDNSRYLKGKAKKYDLSDFALVRATDFLPQDGILMPLCSVPFVTHTNNVASSVIFKLLRLSCGSISFVISNTYLLSLILYVVVSINGIPTFTFCHPKEVIILS